MTTPLFRGAVVIAALLAAWCISAPGYAGDGDEPTRISELDSLPAPERLAFLRARLAAGKAGEAAELYFQMGNTFFAMEELDSAITYYGRAVEVDTTFSRAWVNMGIVYDAQNQGSAAQRAFEQALQADPHDVLAICHLGFAHFTRGETDRAVELYMEALAIDPNSAQAHYNLGLAFADARIFAEALLEWEKVIELDDGDLGTTAAENVKLIKTYMELDEE